MERDRPTPPERRANGDGPRGFFDRPLWRIIVPILVVTFAVHRGVAAVMLSLYGEGGGLMIVGLVVQAVVALAVAVAIFIGRPRLFSSSD